MDIQKVMKQIMAFRYHKRMKPVADSDRLAYLNEVKQVSPVKTQIINTEFAEIQEGLGKSEKFSNKLKMHNALISLQCVKGEEVTGSIKPELSTQPSKEVAMSPVSVDHHFHRKGLTPYSPGVVRIKTREKTENNLIEIHQDTRRNIRTTFTEARQYATPQPRYSKNPQSSQKAFSRLMTGESFSPIKSPSLVESSIQKPTVQGFYKTKSSQRPVTSEFRSPRKLPSTPTPSLLLSDQIQYTGNLIQGQKEGYGEAIYKNGDWYKGNFKKNQKEGTGKYYYKKFQVKYKGEFREDLRWGIGSLVFDSGDSFKASWKKGILEDGVINIKYNDGSEYDGEIKNGKRHGIGRMEYKNGGIYNGGWINDQRTGHGTITLRSDMFFEGIFSGDYTDGSGVLVRKDIFSDSHDKRSASPSALFQTTGGCIEKSDFFSDFANFPQFRILPLEATDVVFLSVTGSTMIKHIGKSIPDGRFVSGKLTGAGIAKYGLLGIYYGGFLEGKRSGFGRMKYSDPEHVCEWLPETEGEYLGEWKEDRRHGFGLMTWPNGTKYEGKYNNDRRHNVIGELTFVNGDVYNGGWVDDRMEGSCLMKRKGIVIKGQFVGGMLSQFAKVEFSDGRVYEGELSNNMPHGTGKMKWPNGNNYYGGFNEGAIDGVGRMVYYQGDIYEGEWENGSRTGKGSMTYSSSRQKYEGQWVDGKRSGEGILKTHKGEIIQSGFWSNDEPI